MFSATGKKNGQWVEVKYDHKRALFNGKKDGELEEDLRRELDFCHGDGAYYPDDPEDPFNVYYTLKYHFFDGTARSVETDEEIPVLENEEGLIY